MRRLLAGLLTAGLLAIAPASAAALKWTPVTGPTGSIIDEVGTVRGPDGTLHVVWTRDTPGGSGGQQDLLHVPISAGGVVGSPSVIAAAYSNIDNPAIVNAPGGLDVFFGAIVCPSQSCASGMFSATSADAGKTWTTPLALYDRNANYGGDMNAVTLADGTPFETWTGTSGVWVHRGSDASTADYDYQGAMGANCCGYYSNLAVDSAGNVEAAWNSNGTNFLGAWVRAVDPASGAPTGSPMQMPGSVTSYAGAPNSSQMLSRTPIIALPGQAGQFFVAYPGGYPSTSKVLLWRVGAPSSTTIVSEPGDHNQVSLAADTHDRVWVFWNHAVNGAPHVYARRLGVAGLEPTVDLGAPSHAGAIYAVDGAVSPGGDPEALALTGFANNTSGTYYVRGPQVAPPANGIGIDLVKLSGTVTFQPAGHGQSFTLLDRQQVPVGSGVNVAHGGVRIEAADQHGAVKTADLAGGAFLVNQRRHHPLVSLRLSGGQFAACGHLGSHHAVRSLATNGGSDFATDGRYATANALGLASWVTQDDCGGTLVKVTHGRVIVIATHGTVIVHAGHSYFAR